LSRLLRVAALLSAQLGLLACTESATVPVSLELRVSGGPGVTTLPDGTRLALSRADLAFGPVYLCAGAQAGATCDTALGEWRSAEVVDTLDPAERTIGELEGYSGRALSYMHDCGLVSLLTRDEPLVLPAADDLGGRSVVIEGTAEVDGGDTLVPFRLELTLASSTEVDRGQPVVRSSPGDFDAVVDGDHSTLRARFTPADWLTGLDRAAFWQESSCQSGDRGFVCAGAVSQNCETGEDVDCSAQEQICAPDQGCQDIIRYDGDSAPGRAVSQAITLSQGLELAVE